MHLSRPEDKDLELAYSRAQQEHDAYLHHQFFNYENDTWLKPWHLYVGYIVALLSTTGLLVWLFVPPEINHIGLDGKFIPEKSALKQAPVISKTLPKSEVSESQNEQQFFENYFGAVPGFIGLSLLIFFLGGVIYFIQNVNLDE